MRVLSSEDSVSLSAFCQRFSRLRPSTVQAQTSRQICCEFEGPAQLRWHSARKARSSGESGGAICVASMISPMKTGWWTR